MSASPEFYKPAPAFSPCRSPLLPRRDAAAGAGVGAGAGAGVPVPGGADQEGAWEEQCCRTPTGAGIELKQAAGTCPPAPRKPRAPAAPCRKRLFEVEVLSLRLDELERLFRRPHAHAHTPPPPPERKMKRRRVAPPLSSPAGPSKS